MSPHFVDVFRVSMGQALAPVHSPYRAFCTRRFAKPHCDAVLIKELEFCHGIAGRGTAAAAASQGGIDKTEQNGREHGEG